MSKKRRVSYRLNKDEALVIAPVAFWENTVDWLNGMAEDYPDQAEEWRNAALWVNEWLERTRYVEPEIEDEALRTDSH